MRIFYLHLKKFISKPPNYRPALKFLTIFYLTFRFFLYVWIKFPYSIFHELWTNFIFL